jgi:hypothetical protein
MQPNNRNLLRVMELTREMLALADEGDRDRDDDTCGIIYGIMRDAAYHLRKLTEEECLRHQRARKWDGDQPPGPGAGEEGDPQNPA